MKVSAGANVSVITRGPGPVPWPEVERGLQLGSWPISTELTPGSDVHTYTLTSAAPLNATRIRKILIRPTDAADATFEIESVRLVYRKEHLAAVPSGVGWQGLSEIYRESLVARAPEQMTFDVIVPERGWLDVGVGTIDDQPATFNVSVKPDGSPPEELLYQETVTTPYRWQRAAIDLTRLAGRKITLALSLTGEPGAVGLWGSPVVRSRSLANDRSAARPRGVIWIHADTLRPDHLSMYGGQRETAPFISQLASQGATFTRAMTQGTWTKASSSSFLTSLYPTTHGVSAIPDRLPASATTIADVYRAAGYATVSYSSVVFTGQLTNLHKGFEEVHEATSQSGSGLHQQVRSRVRLTVRPSGSTRTRAARSSCTCMCSIRIRLTSRRHPYEALWADPEKRDEHIAQRNALRKTIADPTQAARGMATIGEMKAAGVDPGAYLTYDKDWYDGAIRGSTPKSRGSSSGCARTASTIRPQSCS